MRRSRTVMTLSLLALCIPAQAGDRAGAVVTVEDEIHKGATALLDRIAITSTIRYRIHRGDKIEIADITGHPIEGTPQRLRFRTVSGRDVEIPFEDIVRREDHASLDCDMPRPHNGGPAALIAFALQSAETDPQDIRLRALLRLLETHPMPGTYGRGLRAAVWARRLERTADPALRAHYRRLLNDDATWLIKAMKPGGWYSYERKNEHTDNSVTQFANLGVWAAADALTEIPAAYWAAVEKHWLAGQRGDGGWPYSDSDQNTKAS